MLHLQCRKRSLQQQQQQQQLQQQKRRKKKKIQRCSRNLQDWRLRCGRRQRVQGRWRRWRQRLRARAEGGAAAVDDAALRAELARQLLQLRRSVEQAQDAVRAAVATHTDALRTRLAALGTALGTAPAPASSRGGVGGALVLVFVLVQAAFAGAMLQLFRQQNRQKKFL